MKTVLLLVFVLAFIHAEGQSSQQQLRKLPIREGGQTIDAGNIPESLHASDTTWSQTTGHEKAMPDNNLGGTASGIEIGSSAALVRKKPGRTKYANITLKRGASQENMPINSNKLVAAVAKDANLTKIDAGNALNSIFYSLSESLRNGDHLQLMNSGENGNTPGLSNESNARLADLKKLADELVNQVADEAKLTKTDAGNALNALVANLSNTIRSNSPASSNGTLSKVKVTQNHQLLVTVSENKALSFSLGDPDDDGDGVLDVTAIATDPQDSDGDGYGDR